MPPRRMWARIHGPRCCCAGLGGCPSPILPCPLALQSAPWPARNEVDAYVELHQAVFGSKNMTPAWRARTLARPEYRPDLDLVAVAPDGRLAAFCICWLNRGPGGEVSGQVEPLGVHADFRRQGLGRTILVEGLRRLQEHGAASVAVETDNYRDAAFALYTAGVSGGGGRACLSQGVRRGVIARHGVTAARSRAASLVFVLQNISRLTI